MGNIDDAKRTVETGELTNEQRLKNLSDQVEKLTDILTQITQIPMSITERTPPQSPQLADLFRDFWTLKSEGGKPPDMTSHLEEDYLPTGFAYEHPGKGNLDKKDYPEVYEPWYGTQWPMSQREFDDPQALRVAIKETNEAIDRWSNDIGAGGALGALAETALKNAKTDNQVYRERYNRLSH